MKESAQVTCYAGRRYPERPISFLWRGKSYVVEVVEKEWISPEGPCFSVRTDDGRRFQLAYQQGAESWRIVPLGPSSPQEDRR